MNNQVFSVSRSKYLLSCDNINKYNLKSVYNEPKVTKLKFHFFLKNFLAASDFLNKTDINNNIQLKAVLFFYLIYGVFPNVVFQNVKSGKNSKKRNDGDFILKLSLTNKNKIEPFLDKLFIDRAIIFNKISKILSKSNLTLDKNQGKNISYNLKIPGKFFFDVNEFFITKIQDINLRQFKLESSLVYSNIPKNTNA